MRTCHTGWLLEHIPATERIPLVDLEAKASRYRRARKLRQSELVRAALNISKNGQVLDHENKAAAEETRQAADQLLVEVSPANRQVYYQDYNLSLLTTFAGHRFYRSISANEFHFADPDTLEVVFWFPLPMMALHVRGKFVASYSIRVVQIQNPTNQWEDKHAAFREQFALCTEAQPAAFRAHEATF